MQRPSGSDPQTNIVLVETVSFQLQVWNQGEVSVVGSPRLLLSNHVSYMCLFFALSNPYNGLV